MLVVNNVQYYIEVISYKAYIIVKTNIIVDLQHNNFFDENNDFFNYIKI